MTSLNLERERERQAKISNRGDSKFWRPEDGDKNLIRVLTFQHKVTKEDVARKLYFKEELGKSVVEWNYPFVVHYGLVPENSKIPVFSTPEIMEIYRKLEDSPDPDGQEKARIIRPNKRFAMNIVDLNEPDKGVQIFLCPVSIREEIGKFVIDDDYGPSILGIKGRDWKIAYKKGAKDPKQTYRVVMREKDKCRAMNSSVEKLIQDLFDPKVYETFAQVRESVDLEVPESGGKSEDLEEAQGGKGESTGDSLFDD